MAEEPEVEGEAASAGAGGLPMPTGKGGRLQRLLQHFIDRLKALDLSRLETDDLDGLVQLVSEARQALTVLKRRVPALCRASG